jgi:hypothetical protein
MNRFIWLVAVGLSLIASFLPSRDCDGASVWDAVSLGVGGGGVWVGEGGVPGFRDAEAVARGAVSITPHVSLVAGASYGVDRSYVRGSGGFRLTATDVNNPDFGIGVGVSRHWTSEDGSGMDEAAAEAAIGWKPLPGASFLLTGLAAYGIDTGRQLFTVALVFPLKKASGGAQ